MRKAQSGFTMIEMTITLALVSMLGMIVYNVMTYADRQAKVHTEDTFNLILKYGAAKVLVRDISNAAPTYNYINQMDDNGLPYFVLAENEYCQNSSCERKFTMKIDPGQVRSKPLFLLVVSGQANEMIRFTLNTEDIVEEGTGNYLGINADVTIDPQLSIAKSNIPYSPWEKGRLILLQSANSFYDCLSSTQDFIPSPAASCTITCSPAGSCNYATTRSLKLLGRVNDAETDLVFTPVASRPQLLKRAFKVCRPDKNMDCKVTHDFQNLTTPRKFFEDLPFVPGTDNLATITPVALVRYHLEKPSPNSPDHKIVLMRSVAEIVGGSLSFDRAHILMSGVQQIVFTRRNISNATIEYKMTEVNLQQSVK